MTIHTAYIGEPVSRVEGPLKVTGQARYAAEHTAPDLLYGVVVSSTIAKGRVVSFNLEPARQVPGVVEIFTHENRARTALLDSSYQDDVAPPGSPFRPLSSDAITFSGQPIALVVAEEFEVARYAASLIHPTYEEEPHATSLELERVNAYVPKRKREGYTPPAKPRGDADAAYAAGPERITAEYIHSPEHHNPMEPHASTVIWEGDGKLTVYDKIQGVGNTQKYITSVFGLAKADVRVVAEYVGGGFGSGLRPQYQLFLAVMAALGLKRSVRVVLTRQQMFTFTYRPAAIQTVSLSTDEAGLLTSMKHDVVQNTSRFEDYVETIVNWEALLYTCANTKFSHEIAQLDLYTPGDMRAPGATTGVFAVECAIDEMAVKAGVDPLDFRLKNYSDVDQNTDKAYTSKALRSAYAEGAERFGWSKRSAEPGSMRDGTELIGWGMATGVWEAMQMKASARARLTQDGKLEIASATADIGTGTYTIMTQIAAETVGLPIGDVTMKLGDTSLPFAPIEGGSWTAASVGIAVEAACEKVRHKLFGLARGLENTPLANESLERVSFAGGEIRSTADPARAVRIVDVLHQSKTEEIEEDATTGPGLVSTMRFSRYTHSAVFVEVRVDAELMIPRVTRVVSAIAAGRILNPKTARSQILGGIVMGIGMALEEESMLDHNLGRFMNHSLAEYHVPVNADIHDLDVIFVDEPDQEVNPMGVKGLGEIGIVGTAAAVANAIFHATGKRVRELPITVDKLLD